jgi:S1-C subfamily serine protease
VVTLLLSCTLAAIATLPVGATAPSTDAVQPLQRARSAVVGIGVTAAEGARSAETLGKERRGSGVVIGPDGLVLTIGYLLLEADQVQVVDAEGRSLPARAVAYDLATGFGLLRPLLPLKGIAPVPLGSVEGLQPGEPLMAVAGGEDADIALTRVVGVRPFSGYWEYHIASALFTSPPLGNHSGAAIFNQRGELLGIGSLAVADAAGPGRRLPGNMYVPVDLLKPILAELQRSGTTAASRRPWLGLTSAEQGGRVQVVRVTRESPAEAAGLRAGDLVLAVDGERVASLEDLYKKLWARPTPESEVKLTVLQGTDVRQLTVQPIDRMRTFVKPAGI